MKTKPESHLMNRRQFIYGATAGVAMFNILPGTVLRGAERISPIEKVNVAGIGIGSRGGADLEEVAKEGHNVVTRLGNQGHSSGSIRQLCEWVWAGAVGQVHTVHAACDAFKNVYCQLPNLDKLDQKYDVPAGLDYDLWIGPVPFRPYTPFWV